jgi:hypothetical protein
MMCAALVRARLCAFVTASGVRHTVCVMKDGSVMTFGFDERNELGHVPANASFLFLDEYHHNNYEQIANDYGGFDYGIDEPRTVAGVHNVKQCTAGGSITYRTLHAHST